MDRQTLTPYIPLQRPAWQRAFDTLRGRVAAWRRRQRELEELRTLAVLDHRTLRDIGWPHDMRRPQIDPALQQDR